MKGGSVRYTSIPNVILILTDDQGYGDISCLGNPVLHTPHIDNLWTDSVRCTDFHVAPVCTPTRSELLTGRDAFYNHATFVCMGRSLLRTDLPTMADIFTQNDYRTGHFGKWHLGDNYPYRPQDRGFQETIYHPAWGITSAADYYGNDYFDDYYRHKDQIEKYDGYCTDVWFREAIRWIEQCENQPFFAYIATNAPHGPLWVPDQYRRRYQKEVSANEASFFGMIANIDENLGRLEKFLIRKDIKDNTILIFMTDNGTATGENVYNAQMRGRKASLYEGGHRVPFFVHWPAGGLQGGRDVDGLTRGTDVLPTLIDLCQLDMDDGLTFDGISLADSLQNDQPVSSERKAIMQFGHSNLGVWGYTEKDHAVVMWNQWRFLINENELYNISRDPSQISDCSNNYPNLVKQLRDYYEDWWDSLGDNLDVHQPLTIGNEHENPTRLSSCDWAWVYADNQPNIRGCVMDSGTWHLEVDKKGLYSFTLRRWPEESGLRVSDAAPVMQGIDGFWPAGKALPVSKSWIQVGLEAKQQIVKPTDTKSRFEMVLETGPTTLKTWWCDANDSMLAGAYYVTVEHLQL
ncbi:arylsulfatase [Candidatus Poribacteria bacterium]|nr:arylsulfatase [Candidatus Poribacteria bacterium]